MNLNPPMPSIGNQLSQLSGRLQLGAESTEDTKARHLLSAAAERLIELTHSPEIGEATMIDVNELAGRLGVSEAQVRKLARQGKLPHHWVGEALRFHWLEIIDATRNG